MCNQTPIIFNHAPPPLLSQQFSYLRISVIVGNLTTNTYQFLTGTVTGNGELQGTVMKAATQSGIVVEGVAVLALNGEP